ncbi:MAG TPA: ABC transporter permease [Anaerolineae bacterium]|nr:ABC transporter permease [Anaerolineae bacterium]
MILRIATIVVKELVQFRRDRILLLFIMLVPVLQLVLMAQAVSRGLDEQRVVVMDLDRSRWSRQLAASLDNTQELEVRYYAETNDEVRRLLDEGRARLAVIIPAGFGQSLLEPGSSQPVQLIVDGTNVVAAAATLGTASGVAGRFSTDLAAGYGLVVPELIDFRTNVRFNPTLDFRDYTIPAELGFIIYQVTLAIASLGLARERELGTLEQLMVTPIHRLELALGKGLPAIAVGLLNFAVTWAVGRLIFGVPMNGSLLLLAGLTLLFITAVVGWGLFISAVSQTQQQAILFVFIQAMVDITLSGFLVPVKNMPALLQLISRFVPLRHYLEIIRSLTLKGAGLEALWPEAASLALISMVIWLVTLNRIARQTD